MNQAHPVINRSSYSSFAEQALALVSARSQIIKRTLDSFGSVSLVDYLRRAISICSSPLQSRNDLLEVVYRYAAPLLGEKVAETAAQELQTLPAVLTANHHGVDFLAQSVQGSLLFSLREVDGKPATTVPVFACGNVPLNNPTYPRGLLLYHPDPQAAEFKLPIRLPVFPDRHKRKSVSIVEAYNDWMLDRVEQRLSAMVRYKQIPLALGAVVERIIDEDYRNSTVLGLKTYSQQAVILNNRIWKRCFREPEQAPQLVYLELEKITTQLLRLDLNNEDSLIWQIMFNPTLRTEVLSQLDGAKACWDLSKLARRDCFNSNDNKFDTGGCGTIFFWAVDDSGWRVPLTLTAGVDGTSMLKGRDDRDQPWTIPFTPPEIVRGLQAGCLLPSLFTCYLTIGFVRGISCCGGYFQADYLSTIQHGLVKVLQTHTSYTNIVTCLSKVPSKIYLSGMQAVMRGLNDHLLVPVGPVEMIASGGLSLGQIEKMRSLILRDVHLAGLIETLPDIFSLNNLPDNWQFLLAEEYKRLLKDKILVI